MYDMSKYLYNTHKEYIVVLDQYGDDSKTTHSENSLSMALTSSSTTARALTPSRGTALYSDLPNRSTLYRREPNQTPNVRDPLDFSTVRFLQRFLG